MKVLVKVYLGTHTLYEKKINIESLVKNTIAEVEVLDTLPREVEVMVFEFVNKSKKVSLEIILKNHPDDGKTGINAMKEKLVKAFQENLLENSIFVTKTAY